jgi:hypothetical protein
VQGAQEFGIRWDGEYKALGRVIFGLVASRTRPSAVDSREKQPARELHANSPSSLFELLFVEAMLIRDAVDLARFLRDRRYDQV